MNLSEKENVAKSTIKREEIKLVEEKNAIDKITHDIQQ